MDGKTVLCVLLTADIVCCMILDYPLTHITPKTANNQSDFGFSMAYQAVQRRLIVGAPSEDVQGKVYSCDMKDPTGITKLSCDEKVIDLDKLNVPYSRDDVPNPKYFMGASISATSDYFFTCAPLLPMDVFKNNNTDVYGTCIQYDTNANGSPHVYETKMKTELNNILNDPSERKVHDFNGRFPGGVGWTTLIDEANNLLLIAKTSLRGEFFYSSKSTPLIENNWIKNSVFTKFQNTGFAVTALKFFDKQKTYYAFSLMQKSTQANGIGFLRWFNGNKLRYYGNNNIQYVIEDDNLGSMFGAALGAADLNSDQIDDLLVGAPAYSNEDTVECGAIHIYLGGYPKSIHSKKPNGTITGNKNGARFGSTIATQDLDGDGISEIIVSAPYEDGLGAVYVLSGHDIKKTLMKLHTFKMVTINSLKSTKRIVQEDAAWFGFSLQFLTDFDENGCKELAVGSPKTGAVDLFYCVQSIKVTMMLEPIGQATLQSNTYTVKVCAHVEYRKKPKVVVGELLITNNITGIGAYILNSNYTIDIKCESCTLKTFCENVTIHFKSREEADYQFTTQAHIAAVSRKGFNGSEVTTSPNSVLTDTRDIGRHCNGDDCQPQLSMELKWSSSNPYVLGSSASETVNLWVTNTGNSSYESCVWVRVRGAEAHAQCTPHRSGYLCDLFKPLRRDETQDIEVALNMSMLTNLDADGNLTIEAELYEKCDQLDRIHSKGNRTIQYSLSTNQITLEEGVSSSRQVTDKEIMDNDISMYGIQEFMLSNIGNTTWKKISAVISMEKKTYITSYSVSSSKCKRTETDHAVLFTCMLDFLRNTMRKIIVTQKINKMNIESHFKNGTLDVTSELSLYFEHSKETKSKSVTSALAFHRDKSLASNKWLTTLIAVLVATLVLIIITIVLYKRGFFKRQQKEKLDVLKESIRRRSSKRTTFGPEDGQNEAAGQGIEELVNLR